MRARFAHVYLIDDYRKGWVPEVIASRKANLPSAARDRFPASVRRSTRRSPLRCGATCEDDREFHAMRFPPPGWIAPSTPPPPSSELLAALTMTSTFRRVMSPSCALILFCFVMEAKFVE